jgi:predicted phosphodiesterase
MLAADDKARFNGQAARRLVAPHPRADLIISGHTHRVHVERVGDALIVNPGALCPTPGD